MAKKFNMRKMTTTSKTTTITTFTVTSATTTTRTMITTTRSVTTRLEKNSVDFQTLRLVARGLEQMKLKIFPLMVIFMEDLIF